VELLICIASIKVSFEALLIILMNNDIPCGSTWEK